MPYPYPFSLFFFFNDTATTEIYTLSLHDALPISASSTRPRSSSTSPTTWRSPRRRSSVRRRRCCCSTPRKRDRKSTRLNSSHLVISYAVFCLKKKKKLTAYPQRCSSQACNELSVI